MMNVHVWAELYLKVGLEQYHTSKHQGLDPYIILCDDDVDLTSFSSLSVIRTQSRSSCEVTAAGRDAGTVWMDGLNCMDQSCHTDSDGKYYS